MTAKLCTRCQSLSLEFFLAEDEPASVDSSDDDGSFEVVTSTSYNTSLSGLHASTSSGCNLCGMILGRIKDTLNVANEDDSKIVVLKVFDRYHRLAVHFKDQIFHLPVYCDALTGCDEEYKNPPHDVYPLSSPETIRLAASWLSECDKAHMPAFPNATIPTRVIDIGDSLDQKARLVITADNIDSYIGQRYATLSHCWGSGTNTQHSSITTSANLESRTRGIDLSELSKTFQDAIQVARGIGVQFLWIDSLCIVQDDPRDIDRECAEMSKVYACSYCTIAASDSIDGQGGCFKPFDKSNGRFFSFTCRSMDGSQSRNITIYQGFNSWLTTLDGPLQRRGWALQERHLSARILHFTKSRLLFECQKWYSSADRPHMRLKYAEQQNQGAIRLLRIRDSTYKNTRIFEGRVDNRNWIKICEDYSQRSLSFASDKLPALSGLAAWYRFQGDFYAAGMWRSSFAKDLIWRPGFRVNETTRERLVSTEYTLPGRGPRVGLERHRRRTDGLPTWSWASMNSAIVYLGYDATTALQSFLILDYDIQLAGINHCGSIKYAKVKVSGLVTQARAIQVQQFKNHSDWSQSTALLTSAEYSQIDPYADQPQLHVLVGDCAGGDTFRASFYIDVTDEVILPDCALLCLLACNIERYYEPDDPDIAGLVLRDARDGEWRRVGTFQARGDEMKRFNERRELILI